jgi:hypothetical protein
MIKITEQEVINALIRMDGEEDDNQRAFGRILLLYIRLKSVDWNNEKIKEQIEKILKSRMPSGNF